MTALLGFGGRRALPSVVGSLRGRCTAELNRPLRAIPTAAFSTGGEDDAGLGKRKGGKPRRRERDEMIVFVVVPPSKPKKKSVHDKDLKGKGRKDSPEAGLKLRQVKKTRSMSASIDVQEKPKKTKKVTKKKQEKNKSHSSDGIANIASCPETATGTIKKRTRKKKCEQSDDDIKNLLIGSFVPFEGTPVGPVEEENSQFSVDKQDIPEGRFYHLKSSTDSFSFPSVTTVLDNTIEGSSYYRLLKWRLKLTGEHGAKGFDAIRRTTLDSGHSFHKVRTMHVEM